MLITESIICESLHHFSVPIEHSSSTNGRVQTDTFPNNVTSKSVVNETGEPLMVVIGIEVVESPPPSDAKPNPVDVELGPELQKSYKVVPLSSEELDQEKRRFLLVANQKESGEGGNATSSSALALRPVQPLNGDSVLMSGVKIVPVK